jgi:RHH-type proline utilization regulon transcriptional repressor/proline dehydrogenase/delta 1-pyrroline-5-carboxylate dehydrogenase
VVEGEPRFEEPVDLDGFSVPPDALTKETVADSAALPDLEAAATSNRHWWHELYSAERDMTGLRAESNVLRYRSLTKVILRVASRGGEAEIGLLRRAASVVGVTLEVSAPPGTTLPGTVVEEEEGLARRIASGGTDRLRIVGAIGDYLARSCHQHDVAIDDTPVMGQRPDRVAVLGARAGDFADPPPTWPHPD